MEKQIRYPLDTTASNKDNIVEDEYHKLDDRRFKCLSPLAGSFYIDDKLEIFQYKTNYKLKHNIDYVITDIDQSSSALLTGIVANLIIVLNNTLGLEFKVNYRSVGFHKTKITERTIALLEAPEATEYSNSYLDLRNKPKQVTPTFHYHSLSEIDKFEMLLFYLEKIRISIVYNTTSPLRFYITTIEAILQDLLSTTLSNYTTLHEVGMEDFKTNFATAFYNLDKIKNLAPLSSDTTEKIAKRLNVSKDKDGYFLLRAISSFKNAIYATYLAQDYTQFGDSSGFIAPAHFQTLLDLRIGSTVIFDSINNNNSNNKTYDRLVYPNTERSNSQYVIKKISNSVNLNYSIVFAIETLTSNIYYGKIIKSNVGFLAEWKLIKKPDNIINSISQLGYHLSNHDNPHGDNKDHVELGYVENLPLATKLDILTESKERKYFTWAQLDIYMKRFLLSRRPHKTEQLTTKDENIMRNFSVVFSNCGQNCSSTTNCRTYPEITAPPITTTQAPIINWSATPNVETVKANETVTFTITAQGNIATRSFYYTLEGTGLTANCFTSNISGTSNILNTTTLSFTLKDNQTIANMKNIRIVIKENETGSILTTSAYVGVNAIIFDADYFVVEYKFTDGLDLDTQTQLLEPYYPDLVGWCNNISIPDSGGGNPVASNGFLVWGNDNTGTGTETIIFHMDRFRLRHPDQQTIKIKCSAWWFNVVGNNPVGLRVTLFKGGTPVLNGYHWDVINSTSSVEVLSSTTVITQYLNSCNPSPTHIGDITCDISTNTWTIT